jgi:hypothetical protein
MIAVVQCGQRKFSDETSPLVESPKTLGPANVITVVPSLKVTELVELSLEYTPLAL